MLQNVFLSWFTVLCFFVLFTPILDQILNLLGIIFSLKKEILLKNFSYWVIPFLHLKFNLFFFILGLIFYKPFKFLVSFLIVDEEEKVPQKMSHAFGALNLSASTAVEHLYQEVKKMAALLDSILLLSFKERDKVEARIKKYEQITNRIEAEIIEYAHVLLRGELSSHLVREIQQMLNVAHHLESLADYCKYMLERVNSLETPEEREVIYQFFDEKFSKLISEYEYFFAKLTRHEFLTELAGEKVKMKYGITEEFHKMRQGLESLSINDQQKEVGLDLIDSLRDISEVNRLLNKSIDSSTNG